MHDEIGYRYRAPSRLSHTAQGPLLALATSGGATSNGPVAHPFFFSGFVEYPAVIAQALLVVSRVARTRFYVPPNMLAAAVRAADPVVTSTPAGLRFESFSLCCGVYTRLDVEADALDAAQFVPGVTNIDVNAPLRHALAGLRANDPLHLTVGEDALRVTTMTTEVVEEKVPLPQRWLRGFAETQMLASEMTLRLSLRGAALRSFLQGVPKSSATKTVMWATRTPRGVRLASRSGPESVCVAGPERLRVLEPLLRFATELRGYGPDVTVGADPVSSMWVLELPGSRLTVGLSPEKARGFSGEGAVLSALSGAAVQDDAEIVETLLAFDARIDIGRLSREAHIAPERVRAALSLLASFGQVGYDITPGSFFHRPLPVRDDALTGLHPRLAGARKIVDAGDVEAGPDGIVTVRSAGTAYEVRLGEARCTCPWYAKYRDARGPCKHLIAARMHDDSLFKE